MKRTRLKSVSAIVSAIGLAVPAVMNGSEIDAAKTTEIYYAESSAAQTERESFLAACGKKMVIGAMAGAVIGCGIWFMAAFIQEIKRGRRNKKMMEVAL